VTQIPAPPKGIFALPTFTMAEENQTLPQVNGHTVLDVCVVGAGPAGLMLA
jgi:NADPH-dependent 2,4-dienoyl-CoA reductase/sulfur reductase-like enzyme